MNLYAFLGNHAPNRFDPFGRQDAGDADVDLSNPILQPPCTGSACRIASACRLFCTCCSQQQCEHDAALLGPVYDQLVGSFALGPPGNLGNLLWWFGRGRMCREWCQGIYTTLRGLPTQCLTVHCRGYYTGIFHGILQNAATLEDRCGHKIFLDPWASGKPSVSPVLD